MSYPFEIVEHLVEGQHLREYARATLDSQEEVLKLSVKQYIPKDNPSPRPGDVTIIGAHANGFPKELYEPFWEDLLAAAKAAGWRIRGIWIADVAWQGLSGMANEDKLGNDPSWLDHSRDLLHVVNLFRAQMPRPLVGVGHSFGGSCLVNLALLHPRLLSSLVLLDAVVSRFASGPQALEGGPIAMSAFRRDVWPSREEAVASFRRNRFYAAWDPRVLEAWVRYGLREVAPPSSETTDDAAGQQPLREEGRAAVTLATSKHQECFTFLRPSWGAYEADGATLLPGWRRTVPDLDPSLDARAFRTYPFYRPEGPDALSRLPVLRPPVLWVFGTKSFVSPEKLRREKMALTGTGVGGSGGAAEGRVKEVLMDVGHLIPMEMPREAAEVAAGWLAEAVDEWRRDQDEYDAWRTKTREERQTLDDEWFKRLRPGWTKPKM